MSSRRTRGDDLTTIPGIGQSMAAELRAIGIGKVSDLKGEDPEQLYQALEARAGRHIDRCVLYAFRCAVYYASNDEHDPEKLKWWNWKDRRQVE